ncbi:PREDICTED: leucine-rich repeat and fibronectin type-III domain-containing protein 4-like [Priapulus caudatus]|uniref:Leucine-rich repeat and fibronectin type-III domain-containing protein 4-like n=1 Tax=Priapulus caudatus TaxID=37621 RepID=A0ABM1EWD8_PRICU|nr:PREDICTED: leucine-rich repeat and fibronectin type-III domain-containing protein 4-like [Priapulus caudatus]
MSSSEAFSVMEALPRDVTYASIVLHGFDDMEEVPENVFRGLHFDHGSLMIDTSHHHGVAPVLHPASFADIDDLDELLLCYMKLTAVPAVIFPSIQDSVVTLNLAGNAITMLLQGAFAAHGHLLHLILAENNLKYINEWAFTGMPELHALDLTSAGIDYLHPGTFRDAWHLEILKLAGNRLVSLQPGVFAGLHNVEHLDFSGSQIAWVGPGAFDDTEGILRVDLPGQQIYWIGEDAFRGLREIEELNLSDNHLNTLTEEAFDEHVLHHHGHHHGHIHLDITGNPINCVCNINYLLAHPFSTSGTCSAPQNRIGTSLSDLTNTVLDCP